MTDKEILGELKKSYEYLTDIRENGCSDHCCGQLNNELISKMDIAIQQIEDVYFDFYKTLDQKELRVKHLDRKVGEKVYICRCVDGDYEVGNEKQRHCMTCEDLDYYWYNDRDFIYNK